MILCDASMTFSVDARVPTTEGMWVNRFLFNMRVERFESFSRLFGRSLSKFPERLSLYRCARVKTRNGKIDAW